MKLDPKRASLLIVGVVGLAGVFLAFRLYTLDANLKASAGINQKLKTDVERLEAENASMREQSQVRQTEIAKISEELESLRSRDTASGKRNEELEKLVGDAEKTLGNQTAQIAELEGKLREAEERLKAHREKSEGLADAARDAKLGAGSNADYARLMESEWLSALAQTEALQKELENATLELADGNSAKAKMQKEVATMHYNLAVILSGQGQFEPAAREYQRAIQVRPDDAESHYNLAVLYDTQLKERSKALEHYRRYIELSPDGPDSKQVRLWIKEKEFEMRLDHPSILPKEEKRF